MPSRQVIALSVLILVLGGIRTMAVVFSPERCTEPADRRDLIAPGGRNGLP